jgi:hypothetical protein
MIGIDHRIIWPDGRHVLRYSWYFELVWIVGWIVTAQAFVDSAIVLPVVDARISCKTAVPATQRP